VVIRVNLSPLKINGHAGVSRPLTSSTAQCRALAGNDSPRQQEDARTGCRGACCCGCADKTKLRDNTNNSKKQAWLKKRRKGMRGIVVRTSCRESFASNVGTLNE
jgi:hypothetical protein